MDPIRFAYAAALLLIVAAAAVSLSKKAGLGGILGLLAAGMVLGPHTPGPMLTGDVEGVRHFSELGVVFLMFLIGLETHPSSLWAQRRSLAGLGGFQMASATGLVCAFLVALGYGWRPALVISAGLALSSTAFVVQTLRERKELSSAHGKAAFAVLLMQDMAVVPLLSLLPMLAGEPGMHGEGALGSAAQAMPLWASLCLDAALVAAVVCAGKWMVPWLLHWLARQGNRESFFLVSMAAMFLAAIAMDYAGMSMALGAFLMGMMLSDSKYCYQIEASMEPFKGLLMSVFFVSVGMSIDPKVIAAAPLNFGVMVFGALALNVGAMFAVAVAFGEKKAVAARMACLLAQGGEFGFVVFGAAKAAGILGQAEFAAAVAAISVTMALTPLMVKLGDWAAVHLEGKEEASAAPEPQGEAEAAHAMSAKAVICGYGRVGHSIGAVFEAQGIAYVAFDSNAELVKKWRAEGCPVFYGDISNPEILYGNALASAEVIVVTVDDPEAALRACKAVRSACPGLKIVARARDLAGCDAFARIGVEVAVPETLETSLRLASESLGALGVDHAQADELIGSVREKERLPDRRETE